MADKDNKQPYSTPGRYYVDHECIDCDICRQTAPENFRSNEDDGYSYVYAQPHDNDEIEQCEEALDACPVDAIGNDG